MDCLSLHDIYKKYIYKRATTYFNNKSFPKVLFPSTQSQSAVDILKSAFLDEDLDVFVETLEAEIDSYIGGVSGPYSTLLEYGVSLDINSSYPASMHNNMPW